MFGDDIEMPQLAAGNSSVVQSKLHILRLLPWPPGR